MKPAWRCALAAGVLLTTPAVQAQPASAPNRELPQALLAAIGTLQDDAFDFDDDAVYALLAHVKQQCIAPGGEEHAAPVADWTGLLERPNDFRGRPITVVGEIGRNSTWRPLAPRWAKIGVVRQLELRGADQRQPIVVTALLTNTAEPLAIGATIEVTGYFVKIRRYYDRFQQERRSALIVAQGPSAVYSRGRVAGRSDASDDLMLVGGLTLAAAIAVLVLRRGRSGAGQRAAALEQCSQNLERERVGPYMDDFGVPPVDQEMGGTGVPPVFSTSIANAQPSRPASISLADDLANWAADDDPLNEHGGDA